MGFLSLKDGILLACTKDSLISSVSLLLSTSKWVFTPAILVLKIKCLPLTLETLFLIAQVETFTVLPTFLLISFCKRLCLRF